MDSATQSVNERCLRNLKWEGPLPILCPTRYQDIKQDLGREHFEGLSSRGFERHALLFSSGNGFRVAQCVIQEDRKGNSAIRDMPASRQTSARGALYLSLHDLACGEIELSWAMWKTPMWTRSQLRSIVLLDVSLFNATVMAESGA